MAAINKLTDTAFRQTKPTNKEQLLTDGGGLYVRVRSQQDGGSISFRLTYKIDGRQKWVTLGSYPTMTLKDARVARDQSKDKIARGIDPAIDNELQRERARAAQLKELQDLKSRMSINDLYCKWVSLEIKNRKDQGEAVKRMFEKDVLPYIGSIPLNLIKKTDIIDILDRLLERGVFRTSKLTLSLIRQMFRFGLERDLVEIDPTATIRKSKIGGPDVMRDRFLDESEIKLLYTLIPGAHLSKTTECAVWIMLSTCCRIGELSKAKWSEVDIANGVWRIPKENSKNGKAHTFYLSEFSALKWRDLKKYSQSSTWVLPNSDNTSHVCEKSITNQLTDRQLPEARKPMAGRSKYKDALILPNGKWTSHDLRRSGATLMGVLGVRPDVIDLCLNHTEQNRMKRTYQHQDLIPEQKEAWNKLGERLALLCQDHSPNKVL